MNQSSVDRMKSKTLDNLRMRGPNRRMGTFAGCYGRWKDNLMNFVPSRKQLLLDNQLLDNLCFPFLLYCRALGCSYEGKKNVFEDMGWTKMQDYWLSIFMRYFAQKVVQLRLVF